jgi:hypothetical protein
VEAGGCTCCGNLDHVVVLEMLRQTVSLHLHYARRQGAACCTPPANRPTQRWVAVQIQACMRLLAPESEMLTCPASYFSWSGDAAAEATTWAGNSALAAGDGEGRRGCGREENGRRGRHPRSGRWRGETSQRPPSLGPSATWPS